MPTQSWTTPGSHTWDVPSNVSAVTIEVWGAASEGGNGGLGGYASALLPVPSGDTINVHVGGTDGTNGGGGGGSGGNGDGHAGGGASDVRTNGDSYADRIIVAGGGGGAPALTADGTGGDGGGANQAGDDAADTDGGKGGSLSSGGAGGTAGANTADGSDGSFGEGGNGGDYDNYYGGGGGGAGYYGGGGGNGAFDSADTTGGGGGAGWVDSSGSAVSGSMGVRSGDGKVTISYDDPPAAPTNVTIDSVADDSITSSWDADTSGGPIDSFDVRIDRDGTGWTTPAGGPASVTHDGSATYSATYTPSSDSAYEAVVGTDSSFQFRVGATNSTGTAWASTGTSYTTPIPPHDPFVNNRTGSQLDLNWTVKSDIATSTEMQYRRDTGSGYGSWTTFGTDPDDLHHISLSKYAWFGADARYQFRVRHDQPTTSDWVYADYGNEGHVYFSDSFESGDLSAWSSTTLNGSSGVKTGSWSEGLTRLGISGPEAGSNYLWLESGSSTTIDLGDLSGETDVLVKMAVASGSLDTSSEVNTVEWYDGTTWQDLRMFGWAHNRQGWTEVGVLVPSSSLSTDNRLRVQSWTSGGTADYIAVDRVVVTDVLHEYTTPAGPSDLSLDTSVEDEITASWTNNDTFGVNRLDHKRTDSSSWTSDINGQQASSHTITGLDDGERYDVRTWSFLSQPRNGSHSNFWNSSQITGAATTILPAPSGVSSELI